VLLRLFIIHIKQPVELRAVLLYLIGNIK